MVSTLLDNLSNNTSTNSFVSVSKSEPLVNLQRDWFLQSECQQSIVSRHYHLFICVCALQAGARIAWTAVYASQ